MLRRSALALCVLLAPLFLICQADTTRLDLQLDTLCAGDELLPRAEGVTYVWSTGENTPSITPAASGPYAVTITDAAGDVVIDPREVELIIVPDPVLPRALTDGPYCAGQEVTWTVDLTGYDSLQWNDAQGTVYPGEGENNAFVTLTVFPGTALSYVADYARCNEQLTVLPPLMLTAEDFRADSLAAQLSGISDTLVCIGESVLLSVTGTDIARVEWSDGDTTLTRTLTPEEDLALEVTVFSSCGSDTTLIANVGTRDCSPPTDCRILFPEVISPNGDGTNDVFRAFFQRECVPDDYTLRVFNRWGQTVFSTDRPDRSWDGSLDGTPQNPDTYLYLASFRDEATGEIREASGQFALIR